MTIAIDVVIVPFCHILFTSNNKYFQQWVPYLVSSFGPNRNTNNPFLS